MNLIKVENNSEYQLEDGEGLSPYLHLIKNHKRDSINLELMYNHLELLNLRQSEICHQ